jgi:hypothetical protein
MTTTDNIYSDVLNTGFRQANTIQLAPDALVFINGSSTMQDADGKSFQIRENITEINTNLNIDAVPGTANFTISVPDHGVQKYKIDSYRGGIQVMNEVEIYFRGRFLKKIEDNLMYPYYPAFWGLVQATSESYSDGVFSVSISCVDMLRWWQITTTNVNAAILADKEKLLAYMKDTLGIDPKDYDAFIKGLNVKTVNGKTINIYGTTLAGKTVPEIFGKIASVAVSSNFLPLSDGALTQKIQVESITQDLNTQATRTSQMEYWTQRLDQIGRGIRIFNLFKNPKIHNRLDIKFQKVSSVVTPEILVPEAPPLMKSEMKSLLEIGKQAVEAINYEFFLDVTGEIIVKPPFWNMDVSQNTPTSIIDDIDIINYGITQSESEIITRVDVSGSMADVLHNGVVTHGIAIDQHLTLQYGERTASRQMDWLHSPDACAEWATIELARQNVNVRQGTITIMGRPELRLGYPIYVPSRDCFYYVKGIDNHFSFGGSFTTTLTLVAERRKIVDENGVIIKKGLFTGVGQITDNQVPISGTSAAEAIENNNFIKQMFFPTICTPKAQEPAPVVQPNFSIDLSKISSDVIAADWSLSNSINMSGASAAFGTGPTSPGTKPAQIQISDDNGYEIIGANSKLFNFGLTLTTSADGSTTDTTVTDAQKLINKNPQVSTTASTNAAVAAAVAKNFDIGNNSLVVNPNNNALTLDQITNSMLIISSQDIKSKAAGLNDVNNSNNL